MCTIIHNLFAFVYILFPSICASHPPRRPHLMSSNLAQCVGSWKYLCVCLCVYCMLTAYLISEAYAMYRRRDRKYRQTRSHTLGEQRCGDEKTTNHIKKEAHTKQQQEKEGKKKYTLWWLWRFLLPTFSNIVAHQMNTRPTFLMIIIFYFTYYVHVSLVRSRISPLPLHNFASFYILPETMYGFYLKK